MQSSFVKLFLFSLYVISSSLTANAQDATSHLEKVGVAYLPTANALALFVAIEDGIFKKHGLEAEITKFQSGNQIIDTVIAGRADMAGPGAGSGIAIVASQSFPGSLKIAQLAGALEDERNNYQDALIVLNKSSIKNIKDLKGKKVGIFPGIQWRTFAKRIFRKNGFDIDKDITFVEVPVQQQVLALLSSSVDASLAVEPTGAIAEATGQAHQLIKSISTKFLCNPFYMGATALSSEFIKKRPKVAKALVDALDEAIEIIRKEPEKKKQLLIKHLGMTPEQLKFLGLREYVTNQELVSRKKIVGIKTYDPVEDFQKISDIFLEEGVLNERVDVSELIYQE